MYLSSSTFFSLPKFEEERDKAAWYHRKEQDSGTGLPGSKSLLSYFLGKLHDLG